ncbi:uncharacterized protein LOC130737011, partial [Lotus japonicus]|uniref:uncharacterized protein LOC130737011 n=1 Tax=Lotus japonicus TaxID=34305 RepID=UPI0025880A50
KSYALLILCGCGCYLFFLFSSLFGVQNSKSTKGQIKYLVYCMENAILNLSQEQEQMVWLIDFQGFNMSHISIKVMRETAHGLQEHYPERLGLAILYNAPKFFEPFFTMVKPLLETKTYNKVKFGYSDDQNTKKLMEDLFDFDHLESAFGGKDTAEFEMNKYAERMKEARMTRRFSLSGQGKTLHPQSRFN